ncbi:MAG: hypothetical protein QOH17_1893 [Pseudonocardiales bacterium]|jgi:hypothetical protein|nr:hypothetical protein [Pseudonocardiales bacterium]
MPDRSASVRGHSRPAPQSTVTVTFDYTGAGQSWTVPADVTEATFVVNGAAGGSDNQGDTGLGGQAEATVAVTPGAVYTIVVGGAGQSVMQALRSKSGGRGGYGYGPGGAGGAAPQTTVGIPGAGGGGGSAILLNTDVLLVAGGGGGSSNNPGAGGTGGGAQASQGHANTDPNDNVWDGQGGTQTGPGAGGVGVTANPGGAGIDHTGGTGGGTGSPDNFGAGGGGGGWFGGGGGASGDLCAGAGGGGSGYAAPGISATLTAGVHSGNGHITITYPAPSERPTPTAPVGHTHQPSGRPGDHRNDC